ncbi:MAG: glutamine-hydrolyzing GMP synthase [Candidatus Altiarchaeota archaeon]|nr:glutamine-hydrolyzing GMP synthase [Candidatus Altiarchaeota archaeon]MBU4406253.1 glutamine-hydrolyzing GMP synthase [Candidatus Altiarchaeota archaeon]MBU4436674.1 glutamine-hydrolyzing GMP synthase [Candidatus Altiarchaeota archaeon]
MTDCILVLDFGGQYCHLIARRIRELNVYSEIVSPEITAKEIENYNKNYNVRGVIISGGPQSVYSDKIKFDKDILNLDLGILGICYGNQLIAYSTGGKVESAGKKEFGITNAIIDKAEGILKGMNKKEKVWMSHSDTVTKISEDYELLAHTANSPIAAYRHKTKDIYGLQWHPEVVHTENGMKILRNFTLEVCKAKPNWKMEDFIDSSVREIKKNIGDRKAVIALSGGVDSSAAAILTAKAIGKNLISVFVDTGLMRKNEAEQIEKIFKNFNLNLRIIDASERFFSALKGVEDPEKKRKIIGENFIRVFEEAAKEINAEVLVQGTIYPDRIESGTQHACTIKSHHNVGGLPSKLKLEIVEPLADLYKDEVRVVAKKLSLPSGIAERMPFPGPALAIRIIGEITPERTEIVREADAIANEEIGKAKLDMELWQSFAVLLPVKSVGVQGDVRTYKNTIALRMVQSKDGMTANFARIPYDILEKISTRITNEIPQVNRVVYDLTHKPPGTIEWE